MCRLTLLDMACPYHASKNCSFVCDLLGFLTAPTPRAAQPEHFCNVLACKAAPIITEGDALQGLLNVQAMRQSIVSGQALRDLV